MASVIAGKIWDAYLQGLPIHHGENWETPLGWLPEITINTYFRSTKNK
jgi:hypothetical protein